MTKLATSFWKWRLKWIYGTDKNVDEIIKAAREMDPNTPDGELYRGIVKLHASLMKIRKMIGDEEFYRVMEGLKTS